MKPKYATRKKLSDVALTYSDESGELKITLGAFKEMDAAELRYRKRCMQAAKTIAANRRHGKHVVVSADHVRDAIREIEKGEPGI